MNLQHSSSSEGEQDDLDITAELPVLNVTAVETALTAEPLATTDTWIIPSAMLQSEAPAASQKQRELEEQIARRDERLAQLEDEIAKVNLKNAAAQRQANELAAELGAVREESRSLAVRNAGLLELIHTFQGERGVFEGLLGEYEVEIRERDERIAQLERETAQGGGEESRRLAVQTDARELERETADSARILSSLQAQLSESNARRAELENDLHVAEEALNRLEAELRSRSAPPPDAARPVEPAALAAIHDPAPEGAVRLLIRSDDGSEVVHVLTRRTSIGRTPDNDVQIDTKYVSRHHAVVLAGPTYTVIEDLNSTNGVLVNNRRITRQNLKDGDTIAIGKTQFRFVTRGAKAALQS